MEKPNIISYDQKKVWSIEKNSHVIFQKRTSIEEVDSLKKAKKFLQNKTLHIDKDSFSIHVPNILEWNDDNKILSMSYCKGNNLETMLRTPTNRKDGIIILHAMLKFILENRFYWYDFAPRNILVDEKLISIVDFEKGLAFDVDNIKNFLRNRVYEEYSSFLLKDERIFSDDDIFNLEDIDNIGDYYKVDEIKIKRVKATAIALGYDGFITKKQFLNIYKMFLKAEEPSFKNNEFYFPRIELEQILENKHINPNAYNEYASRIIQLNEEKGKNKIKTI